MLHFYLCLQPPELSGLRLDWATAMELPVGQRDMLAELLDEQRSKEMQAHKRAARAK